MKARAIVFTAPGKIEVAGLGLPDPGPGELLLEALYTGISPGTELRGLAGKLNGAVFPFVPGYAMVARVLACGVGVDLAEGTLVFTGGSDYSGEFHRAYGGHMSHAVCPLGSVLPIPKEVDTLEAAMLKMASIPYHGLRVCRPLPEEKIAVIGLGAIGLGAAMLYARAGSHVAACDKLESRVSRARQLGLNAAVAKGTLFETFAPFFPKGADAVIDCTGAPALIPAAMEVLRQLPWGDDGGPGPRYVVQGSYPGAFDVPYGPSFGREISILVPRDNQERDRRTVLDMMKRGALSLKSMVSDVRSPDSAQRTYEELGSPDTDLISAVFFWKQGGAQP